MSVLRASEQERREEQIQRQEEQQHHMQNLQASLQDMGVDPDYASKIMDSDLDQGTIKLLGNMLSRDWVLANFSEAEVHETRWLTRVMVDQLEALHPHENSVWTGEYRKYATGDERQGLEPLDSAQRLQIHEFVQGVIARATRSKEGWQQDTLRKQITQSITEDNREDDNGGWLR